MKRHEILVTFLNGNQFTYTTNILYGEFGLLNDPMVAEIIDCETGEIIFTAA